MRYVQGDLFETDCQAIGHGVNRRGLMGAGVAKIVREQFPEVYRFYREVCLKKPEEFLLGGVLPASDPSRSGTVIFNMATQDLPGPNADLEAVYESAMSTLAIAKDLGIAEVAIPKIGAGIGGLVWEEVEEKLRLAESVNDSKFVIYFL